MCTPVEHDYIGLSDTTKMESMNIVNLKQTELRLGLPGSDSPDRNTELGVSVFRKDLEDDKISGFSLGPLNNFVTGAKRGFSDAIDDRSGKWALSVNGSGSDPDLPKASVLHAGLPMKEANMASPAKPVEDNKTSVTNHNVTAPAAKAQVVGWPPIRSFRKNTLATNLSKNTEMSKENSISDCLFVKVSMDGAPYLRKVDLKTYCNYVQLSSALEKMFTCFTIGQCTSGQGPEQDALSASRLVDLVHGSEYVLTYEDKDGDWMLVGDVPWDMFIDSCKRLRIMKGSEAIGLAPRTMEKCKNRQ